MEVQRSPTRSAHYRDQAARLRGLGEQEPVGILREELLRVARQYDELGRQHRASKPALITEAGWFACALMGERRQGHPCCYSASPFPPDGSNPFLENLRHPRVTAVFMGPGMRSEPVTWSKTDRIVHYRQDAARLRSMAEAETRSSIREQLARLSREYYRIANGISRLLRDG